MSGVYRAREHSSTPGVQEDLGRVCKVFCVEGECALWDGLLGCCGDRSLVEQERQGLRHVVEEMIEGFESSLADGDKKRLEAEAAVEEAGWGARGESKVNHPEAALFEEMGKRRGQVAVLTEVLDMMRTRFRI